MVISSLESSVILMAKKKKEVEVEDLQEFGYTAIDEDGVMLVVKSNAGTDKGLYLKNARKLQRPIHFSIESDIFDAYRFKSFALTREEARRFISEMNRMLDYLDEVE